MNFNRNYLINRLIHGVKNELSTLKLAASNLKYVVNDINPPVEHSKQINEFLTVIQQNIKTSIEALNQVLILTREESLDSEPVNLGQILLELSPKHPAVHFRDHSGSFIVNCEPKLLQWFMETLLDLLTDHGKIKIELKFETKEVQFSLITGSGSIFKELFAKETTEQSFEALTVKYLASALGIKILEQNASKNVLILKFTQ